MKRSLLAAAALALLTTAAQAQVVWSTPASACVPDETTSKFSRHKFVQASVRHANNSVDRIVLICPIPRFESAVTIWNHFMTYQDSTGPGTSAFVRTQLFRLPLFDATPTLLAEANSNDRNAAPLDSMTSNEFTHTFDFDLAAYYMRIELDRSSTSETVILYSMHLVDND